MSCTESYRSIQKLPKEVVDRIAAGEVIERPSNAVKELIENSLDAGSSLISIVASDLGINQITIMDNGEGIRKEDFPLVCRRFATSKIRSFEDINSINSFGFRGEALSSISCIGNLTLISRHKDSDVAYGAKYIDGIMVDAQGNEINEPTICSGNIGTRITVSYLYRNNPLRQKMFSGFREEFLKICNLVGKYALQFSQRVAFTCRKHFDSYPDVWTRLAHNKNMIITSLYKFKQPQLIVPFEGKDSSLDFEVEGLASLPTFSLKNFIFILFINDRLVECNSLKRAILSIYTTVLSKTQFPFVYISIKINPRKLDVNVHPSKKIVYFSNETSLVTFIQSLITPLLAPKNISLAVQPQNIQLTLTNSPNKLSTNVQDFQCKTSTPHKISKTVPSKLNRSDHTEQSIESLLNTSSGQSLIYDDGDENQLLPSQPIHLSLLRPFRVLSLSSVKELKNDFQSNKCEKLANILKRSIYIGPATNGKILLQSDITLLLVDCSFIFSELFYQIILLNFGCFNYSELQFPYNLFKGISEEHFPKLNEALNFREMLKDYFSMIIDEEGNLTHVPQLLKNLDFLTNLIPIFIKKLVLETDWKHEKQCLQTISRSIAYFYTSSIINNENHNTSITRQLHQDIILPLLKDIFTPQQIMLYDRSIIILTSVPELYKIFERC